MKEFSKNKKYILCLAVSFILILCCLMPAGVVLSDKMSANVYCDKQNADEFYSLEKNTIDVLSVGNSQVLSGFVSAELYKTFGYSAFSIGFGHMPVMAQYHWIKEVLKYQSPEVILFEVSGLYSHNPQVGYFRSYSSMSDLSLYKLQGLREYIGNAGIEKYLQYYCELYGFHSRWSSLSKNDYEFLYGEQMKTYGGSGFNDTTVLEEPLSPESYIITDTADAESFASEQAKTYMDKTVELCREEGIELILYKTVKDDWSSENSAGVREYAEEKALEFIDFNTKENLEKLELDFTEDFYDPDHCNIKGAVKMTRALGEHLQKSCSLTDWRQQQGEAHSQMEEILEGYSRVTANNTVKDISNFYELADILTSEGYTWAIGKNGSIDAQGENLQVLKKIGISSDFSQKENAVVIKQQGKAIKEYTSGSAVRKSGVFPDSLKTYYINVTDNAISLRVNSSTKTLEGEGYLVVSVYDNETKTAVCDYVFDKELKIPPVEEE